MRILIDLTYIFNEEFINSGIAVYAFRFLSNVQEMLRKDICLYIRSSIMKYCQKNLPKYNIILYKETKLFLSKIPIIRGWIDTYCWKLQINKIETDCVYISAAWVRSSSKIKHKKIITIHDLGIMHHMADQYAFLKGPFLKYLFFLFAKFYFYKIMSNCDKIITISEYVKKDIMHKFKKINDRKIRVIYNGIPPIPQEIKPITDLTNRSFLLYVGTLMEYKNVITLLHAYKSVHNKMDIKLVIVGKVTPYWTKVCIPMVQQFPEGTIQRYENLNTAELYWLYKNARLLIITSLCEGFGNPPIEAALSGTEVISTLSDSLPEVTMNLVNYYEPAADYQVLSNKILELLKKEPDKEKLDEIRTKFEERYDIKKWTENIFSVIEDEI